MPHTSKKIAGFIHQQPLVNSIVGRANTWWLRQTLMWQMLVLLLHSSFLSHMLLLVLCAVNPWRWHRLGLLLLVCILSLALHMLLL